jgi:hypothetical protein
MMFLIAPKTGHDMHPESRKILNAFLYDRIKSGRRIPDRIRFLTYTTRYNRDYWVTLDGMEKHYQRAEVDASRSDDRARYDIVTKNLTRLVLRETDRATAVSIDGQKLRVKPAPEMAFARSNGTWKPASGSEKGLRKRHGLQGPIDDAFLEPFLVVRPTGTPWNVASNDQALRVLQRFERQYALAYRGHIRVKTTKMSRRPISRSITLSCSATRAAIAGSQGSMVSCRRCIGRKRPSRWAAKVSPRPNRCRR